MNKPRDKYALCLNSIHGPLIKIARFSLEEVDKLTMNFSDGNELLNYIIKNHESLNIDHDNLKKLQKQEYESETNNFVLEHFYNTAQYNEVFYQDQSNFKEVKYYLSSYFLTTKSYLNEVILSPYNKKILSNKVPTQESLKTVTTHLDSISSDFVTDHLILSEIKYLYKSLYPIVSKEKYNYSAARIEYVAAMKYIDKYDYKGKIDNPFNYHQLKDNDLTINPVKQLKLKF